MDSFIRKKEVDREAAAARAARRAASGNIIAAAARKTPDPPQRLKRPPIERQLVLATESARKAKQAAVRLLVDVVFLAQRAPRAIFFLPFIRRRPSHVHK